MKFIHLTDTHVRKKYSDDGVDAILKKIPCPAENVRKLFERTDWKGIDFVVITGDLVHEGTVEDYRYFRQILEELIPESVEILYVLGNHDHKKEFYKGMLNEEKESSFYYAKNIQGYRLIVLDSAIPEKVTGKVTKEQIEWLKETLETPSEKGSVIFIHHPIFWGSDGSAKEISNKNEVLEVLKKSDVIAVFCGHTHCNAVQIQEGIPQYTSDSMAFSIDVNRGILAFTDKTGYATVEVQEKKSLVHHETVKEDVPVIAFSVSEYAELVSKMDE